MADNPDRELKPKVEVKFEVKAEVKEEAQDRNFEAVGRNRGKLPKIEFKDEAIDNVEASFQGQARNLGKLPKVEVNDEPMNAMEEDFQDDLLDMELKVEVKEEKVNSNAPAAQVDPMSPEEVAKREAQMLATKEKERQARAKLKEYFSYIPPPYIFKSGKALYQQKRWWWSLTDEERQKELAKKCSRCEANGHDILDCPLPMTYKRIRKPVTYFDGTRRYRCSRCHKLGHNINGCHGHLGPF